MSFPLSGPLMICFTIIVACTESVPLKIPNVNTYGMRDSPSRDILVCSQPNIIHITNTNSITFSIVSYFSKSDTALNMYKQH